MLTLFTLSSILQILWQHVNLKWSWSHTDTSQYVQCIYNCKQLGQLALVSNGTRNVVPILIGSPVYVRKAKDLVIASNTHLIWYFSIGDHKVFKVMSPISCLRGLNFPKLPVNNVYENTLDVFVNSTYDVLHPIIGHVKCHAHIIMVMSCW